MRLGLCGRGLAAEHIVEYSQAQLSSNDILIEQLLEDYGCGTYPNINLDNIDKNIKHPVSKDTIEILYDMLVRGGAYQTLVLYNEDVLDLEMYVDDDLSLHENPEKEILNEVDNLEQDDLKYRFMDDIITYRAPIKTELFFDDIIASDLAMNELLTKGYLDVSKSKAVVIANTYLNLYVKHGEADRYVTIYNVKD